MNSFHTDSRQRLQFTVRFEIDLDLNKLCTSLTRLHSKKAADVESHSFATCKCKRYMYHYITSNFSHFFSSKTEATKGLNVASWEKFDNFWKIKRYTKLFRYFVFHTLKTVSKNCVLFLQRQAVWPLGILFLFFQREISSKKEGIILYWCRIYIIIL